MKICNVKKYFLHLHFVIKNAMDGNKDVLKNNIANYSGRAHKFADWAFGSEASSAAEVTSKFLCKLKELEYSEPLTIIDLGCGPGRDLDVFKRSTDPTCKAIGVDACQKLCSIAKRRSSCEVICTDFASIGSFFATSSVLGIFCLASLFHLPRTELPSLLKLLYELLMPSGLLLTSFSYSRDEDRAMSDGRWNNSLPLDLHQQFLIEHKFEIVEIFKCRIYNGQWGVVISKKS